MSYNIRTYLLEEYMKTRVVFTGIIFTIMCSSSLSAQDVPFLWGHHWGVGARAVGMGGAFTGVADDYSALYYNPAGMGQLKTLEAHGTFSHLSMTDRATFLGVETSESSSYTKLNAIGICVPVPTSRGSLVFGFGYHNIRDFDSALFVTAFKSTPGDSVTQSYNELIAGGLSNVSFGTAVEMAPGLFIGGAINFWTGSHEWTWQFTEVDQPYNIWEESEWVITDYIYTKLSAINFTLSTLFLHKDTFRFGGAIITPISLGTKEDWEHTETTLWDDGYYSVDSTNTGFWESEVRSPWIFRLGGALKQGPIMVAADVEFIDYSQISFPSTSMDLEVRENLQNTMNWRVGGEFTVPTTGLRLRGGYAVYPSAWKNETSGMDRKIISFGAGYSFQKQFTLDFAYAFTSWDGLTGETITQEKIEANKILFSLSYHMQ